MPDLKTAINIVELVLGMVACVAIGDYLGYRFGRRRLAIFAGVTALAVIVLFAIYAMVVLA